MKNFFLFFFVLFSSIYFNTNSNSEIVKKIEIIGNERIADETIIIFFEINLNENFNDIDLNNAFKKIYSTNYFNDLKLNFSDGIVTIYVKENPLIQTIKINGIKNKSLVKAIEKITKKKEKYPFEESVILNQKNLILNIVKKQGFYLSTVVVEKVENENNTIDIVYNFDLGKKAEISKINFTGNKIFRESKLKNIILSEETKPWKFVTKNKFIDSDRISLDENLLSNFFKNKGYYDIKIKSTFAKLEQKNLFNLNFNIDPGEKYYFNNLDLIISNDYKKENFSKINDLLINLKGKKYSLNKIEKIINEIDKIALQKEFVFINAKYEEKVIDKNKLNLKIYFEDDKKS